MDLPHHASIFRLSAVCRLGDGKTAPYCLLDLPLWSAISDPTQIQVLASNQTCGNQLVHNLGLIHIIP